MHAGGGALDLELEAVGRDERDVLGELAVLGHIGVCDGRRDFVYDVEGSLDEIENFAKLTRARDPNCHFNINSLTRKRSVNDEFW